MNKRAFSVLSIIGLVLITQGLFLHLCTILFGIEFSKGYGDNPWFLIAIVLLCRSSTKATVGGIIMHISKRWKSALLTVLFIIWHIFPAATVLLTSISENGGVVLITLFFSKLLLSSFLVFVYFLTGHRASAGKQLGFYGNKT